LGCDGEYQSGCKDHNGRGFQLRIDKKRAEVRTTRRAVTSGRAAKRYASAQKQKKKEGNTLIFDTILSSTRRAALDTSGGPTILRVKGGGEGVGDVRMRASTLRRSYRKNCWCLRKSDYVNTSGLPLAQGCSELIIVVQRSKEGPRKRIKRE
jgi:hypothetical protein